MPTTALPSQLRPRKQPRQRRAAETRARILDAARQVFERHGYSHGTTNRIAAAAGLSVGSLYQYFPNKDAILVELVDAHIDAGAAAVRAALTGLIADTGDEPSRSPSTGADPSLALNQLVQAGVAALVTLHGHDRRLHRVLFEEAPRPPEQLVRLRALETELVGQVAALLDGHPEVRVADVALAARLVVDAVESLVHRIATDETSGIPDDALTREITQMVVAYLATGPVGAQGDETASVSTRV